jgi:hypothetical protein
VEVDLKPMDLVLVLPLVQVPQVHQQLMPQQVHQ